MPKHSPTDLFLVIGGGRAPFNALVFTVNPVYQVETVGLGPLQLVLVGTVLEVTVVVLEAPTGAVADVYSRRLSVIAGMALVGCGFLPEGSAPLFWAAPGAQVLWGAGYTVISGALQAWLALVALWLINLCRSTLSPLESAWIVRVTPGGRRATVISLWGQANSFGQVCGGPFVGWVGTVARIPAALTVSSLMPLPAQWLLALARGGERSREPAPRNGNGSDRLQTPQN